MKKAKRHAVRHSAHRAHASHSSRKQNWFVRFRYTILGTLGLLVVVFGGLNYANNTSGLNSTDDAVLGAKTGANFCGPKSVGSCKASATRCVSLYIAHSCWSDTKGNKDCPAVPKLCNNTTVEGWASDRVNHLNWTGEISNWCSDPNQGHCARAVCDSRSTGRCKASATRCVSLYIAHSCWSDTKGNKDCPAVPKLCNNTTVEGWASDRVNHLNWTGEISNWCSDPNQGHCAIGN